MDVVTNLWKGEDGSKKSPVDESNTDNSSRLNETSGYSAAKNKRKSVTGSNLNKSNGASTPNGTSDNHSRSNLYSQGKSVSSMDKTSSIQQMMTDSLVEKIIKMALPPSSLAKKGEIATRLASAKNRPSLSVQLLSKNVIQMNSRLGIPFMFIDNVIEFIDWVNPPMTLAIMCLYTLCVLNPIITIACGPICYILFQVMVPHYMQVHSPNPINPSSPPLEKNRTPAQGPPLREPILPEPVREFSQEFVMNLQDLQNHVLLYVAAYDFIYFILKRFAFFINEQVSTAWFIILLSVGLLNYLFIDIVWPLIPIKLILVIAGWSLIVLLHPKNRDNFMQKLLSEETRLSWLQFTNEYEHKINEQLRFVEARENRVVDIFEIQVYKSEHKEWNTVGYHFDDYTVYSNKRLEGENIEPLCAKTIDEINPPIGWDWISNSTWKLNLSPEKWVRERFINNVRVDSETKWVYDKVEDCSNKSTKIYRRRMWIRHVARKIKIESHGATLNDDSGIYVSDINEDGNDSVLMEKIKNMDNSFGINENSTTVYGVDGGSTGEELEEVVNPLREEYSFGHNTIRGIARRSMSGATKPTPTTTSTSVFVDRTTNQDHIYIPEEAGI
ncbi:peroxisomal membrane protein Pex29p [Monosporozyma servazzii]